MFPSEIAKGLIGDRDPSKEDPSELRFIPARRFGGEEDMTGAVLYLASRAGAVSSLCCYLPFTAINMKILVADFLIFSGASRKFPDSYRITHEEKRIFADFLIC